MLDVFLWLTIKWNELIFPRGLSCNKFPVISSVKLLFWGMLLESDCRSSKVFLVKKHPISEHLQKFLSKRLVCLSFDGNTLRLSYVGVFQQNTSYQGHGFKFHSMVSILKVERKTVVELWKQQWNFSCP